MAISLFANELPTLKLNCLQQMQLVLSGAYTSTANTTSNSKQRSAFVAATPISESPISKSQGPISNTHVSRIVCRCIGFGASESRDITHKEKNGRESHGKENGH